jgi:hypothetical protein
MPMRSFGEIIALRGGHEATRKHDELRQVQMPIGRRCDRGTHRGGTLIGLDPQFHEESSLFECNWRQA